MMISIFQPFLIYYVAGFLCFFVSYNIRKILLVLTPPVSFLSYLLLQKQAVDLIFLDQKITFFQVDSINIPFFYAFILISLIGFIFNIHRGERKEFAFPLFYAGSAIGLLFTHDLISLFFFWELMALFSTFVIWLGMNKKAESAGLRYLFIHLIGGILFLVGILLFLKENGNLSFQSLKFGSPSSWFILLSVLINTATPPFSAWLSDAYPESSIGGTVFLSAFTTKSAVYVLCRLFAGTEILIYLGSIMAIYGVIYAFMVLDMRRLLSYHIISQVGFMVCGVGIGTTLAINGVISHAFTHIFYKGLLLMSVGTLCFAVGTERLNELGGLLKNYKMIFFFYSIGALSISGAPLLSGFVSKSITITSTLEAPNYIAWIMLNMASVGTFISVGLKLPYLAFLGNGKEIVEKKPIPLNMKLAMSFASGICIILGVYPDLLYSLLPYEVNYRPYTFEHIIFVLQLFIGSLAVFILYSKNLEQKSFYIILDTDWFYRKLIPRIIGIIFLVYEEVLKIIENLFHKNIYKKIVLFIQNPLLATKIIFELVLIVLSGREDRNIEVIIKKYPSDTVKHWPIGVTILYTTFLLTLFLLIYYLA
ncbi:MAG: Na(+)/H(+) antiporter subunit D [Proteobacteria bacterium]|nr:Na(+)/H(+) antiporter subunit D [Pseudomonadota bacterium]